MINKPRMMHLDERVIRVSMKIYDERMKICENCYAHDKKTDMCKIVGATVQSKCALKAGACPMGFWSSNYDS